MFDPFVLDAAAVIIDNGTASCKAGRSGENGPQVVIPTVTGRVKNKASVLRSGQKDFYVANDALYKKSILKLKYPIEKGVITEWEDMEKIWKHIYDKELQVKATDRPLLMSEPPLNPLQNREITTEIMFETIKAPAMYLSVQSTLALYSAAHITGTVLDCGESMSHAVPIYEGYYLPHAVSKLEIGGKEITDYLSRLLQESGHSFASSDDNNIINDIKEQLCYVALDPNQEIKKSTEEIIKNYHLPDGKAIQISNQLYLAPEILFFPATIGIEFPGVDKMIFKSVMKCEAGIRKKLYRNMVLTGGSSLFRGLDERVLKEVQQHAPSGIPVRMIAPPDRKFSVWIGASIITSLTSFKQMWVTSNDYQEFGPSVVQRRCF
ncbi:actin-related protein T2-like [Discoglossus pictus]